MYRGAPGNSGLWRRCKTSLGGSSAQAISGEAGKPTREGGDPLDLSMGRMSLGPQGKPAGGRTASRLAIETISDVILPLLTTAPSSQPVSGNRTPGDLPQPSRPLPVMPPSETMLAQWMKD